LAVALEGDQDHGSEHYAKGNRNDDCIDIVGRCYLFPGALTIRAHKELETKKQRTQPAKQSGG
jgi:hypothetical protein